MSEELVKVDVQPLALRHELSIEELVARVKLVHRAAEEAMVEGHHYGKIPGTDKDTLLKPGAELLCVLFRLDPQYSTDMLREGGHITVTSTCTLWHIPTGQRWGSGMGSCSTRESKYAYRKGKRTCPKCGSEQINKSKFPPRGAPKGTEPGWYCYAKAGGCGQEFAHNDPAIVEQATGRVVNEELADTENTVLKMANKRSLVAAVLNVTAASDIFTQDLEDLHDGGQGGREPAQSLTAPPRQRESETETASQHEGLEKERLPAETIGEEGARLFKTPEEEAAELAAEKATRLGRIGAGMDMLKLGAGERTALWAKFCHTYAFMTDAPDLYQLDGLLDELRRRHAAAKSREKK